MKRRVVFTGCIVVLCAPALCAVDGFATMGGGTTGGAGGTLVTVDNVTDLERYAETPNTPYIIRISGTIEIGNSITICSNKTLRGEDSNATLIGNLGFRNRDSNILIERLNITNPNDDGEGDGISLKQEISNVFITRCTFYDCQDGCLDISNESDLITVSWCKFYYTRDTGHNFVNLIGSSDKQTDDRGKLRVTMHHNGWSSGCKERMPRVRFGQVHLYNNCYGDDLLPGGYCIGVGVEAHIRVENNYFNRVSNPWKNYYEGKGADGEIGWNDGNVFFACAEPAWAENRYAGIFIPPYSYTLDDAADVPVLVQYGAGADGREGDPPHWFFGSYGDFDRSGLVDCNDLAVFTEYWMDTEDIDDADYDHNGQVNLTEFALFADHYRHTTHDTALPQTPGKD
ncbi:MAG: hypothetical protein JW828_02685 [Sedimentisphaerales bacterium]|nr:hypothetical protein [Sedimentisphaerales bacterium]